MFASITHIPSLHKIPSNIGIGTERRMQASLMCECAQEVSRQIIADNTCGRTPTRMLSTAYVKIAHGVLGLLLQRPLLCVAADRCPRTLV
jgi:hypothetical protein